MKEYINGDAFEDENKCRVYRKPKFDKSRVVPDTDKSCGLCKNAKLLSIDKKKGIIYECKLKNYIFYGYWKQTKASDCDNYNSAE